MISVIIPLYNKEKQITNTLQTVLNQTYKDFEIVIVNDGSTDNGIAEIENVKDSRIRIIHQQNAGVSAARNRGIKEAKYDLIAFLDADDEWDKDYLETIYGLYKKYPKASVFGTSYRLKDEKQIHQITLKGIFDDRDGILDNYFDVAITSSPPLWTSAVAVKKETIMNIGGFPVGVTSGEDLITWARLACYAKIAYSKIPHATYIISLKPSKGNEPNDLQTTNDFVGLSLEKLYKEAPNKMKNRISKYISFWYKMRASINLDLGHKIPAVRCATKSLRYNFKNWKVYCFFPMILLPNSIISMIIYKFRKL